jgi:PAS domain S-box-containing protein
MRAGEEQFRLMVDAVKDYALLTLDPEGIVVSWNAGAERIKGYKASEIIGKHFSCFYSPEDMARGHPAEVLGKARGAGRHEEEGWRIRKDGSRFWAHLVITAIRDKKGKLRGFVKVTRDITEKKQNEEALRLSEVRFALAFEHAAIGMALVSPEGKWLKVNTAICALTGYPADELMKKTFQEITHPEDLDLDLANVQKLLKGEINSYRMEKRYFRKDGRIVWVLLGVSLVRDKENRPLYFISQIEDITENKEAMARQLELTAKAQAAERAKSEFLAIMSHEIRTPMNGVIGMTGILADTELNEMQRDCVRTIASSGESLLAVINDILDYSKIEVGRMEMESRSFNLRECLEEALDLFATQIRLKNLEVAYLIAPEVPAAYRRSDAVAAGAGQSHRQRGEVHRTGRNRGQRRKPPPARGGLRAPLFRGRYRHRHSPGGDGAAFPGVPAGRYLDHAALRRHGARPGHQQAHDRAHGRHDVGRERARPRIDFLFHRKNEGDGGRIGGEPAGRARGAEVQIGADRGRCRDEPAHPRDAAEDLGTGDSVGFLGRRGAATAGRTFLRRRSPRPPGG